MTDTPMTIEQAIAQANNAAVAEDFKPQDIKAYRCTVAGCGKAYPTKNGLQGHSLAHKPAVPCPECRKMYRSAGALGNHRKHEHGVVTGPTPRQEKYLRAAERRDRYTDGWSHDDVFTAVMHILWPDGQIPVRALLPLIQWREDTRTFLEQIHSE